MWNTVIINIYFVLILKRLCHSCDCEWKKINVVHDKDPSIEKRNLDDNISTTTSILNIGFTEATVIVKSYHEETERNTESNSLEYNEEDLYETSCPYYNKISNAGLDRMADVWQTAYYKTNEKVACFKIYIRRITHEEQEYTKRMYGDFNHTVDWNNSVFEIHSNDKYLTMKHFLFGDGSDFGVLNNIMIIIEDNDNENDTRTYLQEESPDQWMVDKNLLLMRDCDTGDVVVFSRVPHDPKLEDIHDAFKAFGEDALHGTFACIDEKVHSSEMASYIPEKQYYVRSIKKVLRDVYNKLVSMTLD
ncbi:hypothetical protein K1T71_006527 [Dendrolimus kikuchii]|uniref:Uncharacterized protein n=1 Tax=Dendrolimus kikuchii TaxID=765133 RepID=A0ACC1D1P7_9NEOP|nr:hypothetical protein K1T71_006527 [Dendrolimus kikuchii]